MAWVTIACKTFYILIKSFDFSPEKIAQSPSTMSTLKVLQNFPAKKKVLLSTIQSIDPSYSNLVVFNHENYTPQFLA